MAADGLRCVLWLQAERGDWREQRQQTENRHAEVERFFHASKFDAVRNGFDAAWTELFCYFNFILLRLEVEKRGKESVIGVVLCGPARTKIIAMGVGKDLVKGEEANGNYEGAHGVSDISYRRAT